MERKTGIQKEYVQVRRKNSGELTFGGDQGFFGSENMSGIDEKKKNSGCGIVAFADLLLYLAAGSTDYCIKESMPFKRAILKEEEYKGYYDSIYALLGGVSAKSGISCLKLWRKFNALARKQRWRLRARWGFSGRKLPIRIKEMLTEDIPVILCIPMMILKKDKKDGLWLYERKQQESGEYTYRQKACTSGHYVTITGVIEEKGEIFYEISSWGKQYFINWNEYDSFIHAHFMGTILGNILYIRKRKGMLQ